MKEKSIKKNHGGGIIGKGIIEEESLRRKASGRHLGGIWEASTVGFPPNLSKDNRELNNECYQFAVHGAPWADK